MENTDIEIFEKLFNIHLNPIKEDINELKLDQKELRDDQKKIIEIISVQSEHNVLIHDLEKHIDECREDRIRMDADRERMKEKGSNRLWEILTYVIAIIIGFIINHFTPK